MTTRAEIFHMEVGRRLNHPWYPPHPYKVDQSMVIYARERIVEVMESFKNTAEAYQRKIDSCVQGGMFSSAYHQGVNEAVEFILGQMNQVVLNAEREELAEGKTP